MADQEDDLKGRAVLFSEMTPPEGGEDAFNAWYDRHHTPSHVEGVLGFLSAMRYKSALGPHYLAVYELDGLETLESEEYRSRKFTPDEKTRETLENVSGFTRYIGNEGFCATRGADLRQALDAPVLCCNLFTVPMQSRTDFDQWFDTEQADMVLECEDWLMARRYDIVGWDPEPHTHLILHYLSDIKALESDALKRARTTDWHRRLASESWYVPTVVTYHRRRTRFLKTGPASE